MFLCVLALYVLIFFPLFFPLLSKLPTQSLPAILIVIGNMMIVPMAFGVPPVIHGIVDPWLHLCVLRCRLPACADHTEAPIPTPHVGMVGFDRHGLFTYRAGGFASGWGDAG